MKPFQSSLRGMFRRSTGEKSHREDHATGFPRQPLTVLDVLEPRTREAHH